jgi:hypothetical protein
MQQQQSTQVFGQTFNDHGLPIMAVIFSGSKAILLWLVVVAVVHN